MGSCAAPSAKGDDKFITTDYLQQCLSACNCIYNSLEQHYSPQFVESLPKLSLQNIDAKMNFVETMNQTMQQCQLSASKH
ncbi:hypothetical protein PSO27_001676 [Acinetobacter baumannii]|nr:hypothetical protein [Acinetobacter baumannii]